jgi:hypothetical protein
MKIQNLLIAGIAVALGVWAYKKYGKKDDAATSGSESKMSNCCGA